MFYAGIGSRDTPEDICQLMIMVAKRLAELNCTLRSGGARGADTAFEKGCDLGGGKKEIYLPWPGFNGNKSELYTITEHAKVMAREYHPRGSALSESALLFHSRNCYQVLGYTLAKPASFVLCWTSDGKASGGTGQAIRIARAHNIAVLNFFNEPLKQLDQIREALNAKSR